MTWRVEAWTDPTGGSPSRRIVEVPVETWNIVDPADTIGQGTITVPVAWPHLGRLLTADPVTPSNAARAFLSIWREGATVPDFEWVVGQATERTLDTGVAVCEFTGPCVRSLLDQAVVYPDPQSASGSHIWGGRNLLPPLDLADLGNVRSEWTVALPGETYEVTPTGDDWTLTVDGNTTAGIPEEPSAGTIRSRLEDLPGVNEVGVQANDDGSFTVEFVNPRQVPGTMTGTDATVTQVHAGYDGTAGLTFKLEVTANEVTLQTTSMPAGASASQVEGNAQSGAGLQGLANINDVTVSGRGLLLDPWVIVAFNPPRIDTITVEDWTADDVVVETVEGALSPEPVTVSQYVDARAENRDVNHGTYDDPALWVDTVDVRAGSTWSAVVEATGQFGGAQVVTTVPPGGLSQLSIWVKPDQDGRYRAVVRDPFENLIKMTSPAEVFCPAGVWTELVIPDVWIPPGVDTVVVRVAVVSDEPASWGTFRVDFATATLTEGRAHATVGRIVLDLLDHAADRGMFTGWLTVGFDEALDSSGVPWDDTLSFRADPRARYGSHILAALQTMGYEWDVVRNGAGGFRLDVWNPGGRGAALDGSGAAVVAGAHPVDGRGVVQSRYPERTVVLVEDDSGGHTEATIGDYTGLPRLEAGWVADYAPDPSGAVLVGEALLRDDRHNLVGMQHVVVGVPVYALADVGTTIPYSVGGFPKHGRRISVIAITFDGVDVEVEVTASRVFVSDEAGQQAALFEGVRRLFAEFAMRRRAQPVLPVPRMQGGGGGGGMATMLVAPASSPLAAENATYLLTDDDGVANALTIATALGEIAAAGGGTLWLHGPVYLGCANATEANQITIPVPSGCSVRGVGQTTTVLTSGRSTANTPIFDMAADSSISDLSFGRAATFGDGDGSIIRVGGDRCSLTNLRGRFHLGFRGGGIRVEAGHVTMQNCRFSVANTSVTGFGIQLVGNLDDVRIYDGGYEWETTGAFSSADIGWVSTSNQVITGLVIEGGVYSTIDFNSETASTSRIETPTIRTKLRSWRPNTSDAVVFVANGVIGGRIDLDYVGLTGVRLVRCRDTLLTGTISMDTTFFTGEDAVVLAQCHGVVVTGLVVRHVNSPGTGRLRSGVYLDGGGTPANVIVGNVFPPDDDFTDGVIDDSGTTNPPILTWAHSPFGDNVVRP